MLESKLQAKIIKFLRDNGAYVIKTKPGMGTPRGCPDIIALYEGAWLAIEVKASADSGFQPGQELTIKRLREWSHFVFVAYPDNWLQIKRLLLDLFF